MRTREEVEEFRARAFQRYVMKCKECSGRISSCSCRKKFNISMEAYESCIPQDFWYIEESDVTNNVAVFENTVKPYIKNISKALKKGYGLVFLGDNGVGKTYFISFILMSAIRMGKSTYYTTMPDLDFDIKRGFKDGTFEERLQWMLTSDFLAIDELGKERAKKDNQFMDAQVERMIKKRLDDNYPMLLATNMDADSMDVAYGPTIASMLSGKFQTVTMEPGDFRSTLREKMIKDMGY